MLFVISAMRLLALFSIAMGVADDGAASSPSSSGGSMYEDDTIPSPTPSPSDNSTDSHTNHTHHHHGGYDPNDPSSMEQRTWENGDYFDLVVSVVGFYVATLGMKATQENTLRLATMYCIGSVIAGVLWNAFNVYGMFIFYKEETESLASDDDDGNGDDQYDDDDDEIPTLSTDDMVTLAFVTVVLPLMVWGLCWTRAFEFRRLILEAEHEASERIRSQTQTQQQQESDEPETEEQETSSLRSGRRRRGRQRGRNNNRNSAGIAGQELDELSPPPSTPREIV
mmetsp:Transcript_56941/g.138677  ORF Transcript_56941/g.138677 Transcript_56941/m.138677 type:complete len:282 (-) Transcript_56941:1184-2029(-)